MKKSLGATIGAIFKLNLQKMVRNFYILTAASVLVGIAIYISVTTIWNEVRTVKEGSLPQLIQSQETGIAIEGIALVLEKLYTAEEQGVKDILRASVIETNSLFNEELGKLLGTLDAEEDHDVRGVLELSTATYLSMFEKGDTHTPGEVFRSLQSVKDSLKAVRLHTLATIDRDFNASESAKTKAVAVIVLLTLLAIVGLAITAIVLSGAVGVPVTVVADSLAQNSKDIEDVLDIISDGAKKQTDIVQTATKDLEDMIINIIQGSITLSVEKQAEIAKAFGDFLKQFVERTAAEIAMGMMSVSQQAKDARSGIEDFAKELSSVEGNIKEQEDAVEKMVTALKSMVVANAEIKTKAAESAEAADIATVKVGEGQKRIEAISEELAEVRIKSEGVRDITESLAKITEDIKILALNMSLKVEDIRDDTGKSYGFETMSARVQELAEEVERLLTNSRDMIVPTIEGIEKVSIDANETKELINDVTNSIKVADEQSRAIAEEIEKQSQEIDSVEVTAENLRTLARQSTTSIEAQTTLIKDVDELLKDTEILVDSVNMQTKEASDGARKVNDMMAELKLSMDSIEEGTSQLTEKSVELSEVFDTISIQANKNLEGSNRLDKVSGAVKDVTSQLSVIVRGESKTLTVGVKKPITETPAQEAAPQA
jgi:methyl-accepting chemotaxis protein